MRPQNMVSGTNYKTSLDVKMYNQYVSASDYFNVQVANVYSEDIHAYRIFPGQEIDPREITSTVKLLILGRLLISLTIQNNSI